MIIAIDFDGTCVTHEFPYVGKEIGAIPILKELVRKGHKIILNTVRDGKYLSTAVEWFRNNGIELYGINSNPSQYKFSMSSKVHADLFIDDLALGCPLIQDILISDRPFVNWKRVEEYLKSNRIL